MGRGCEARNRISHIRTYPKRCTLAVWRYFGLGGRAKDRREEIAALKTRSDEDAARWRQMKNNMRSVASGLDPFSPDIDRPVAMTRALPSLFLEAKRSGSVGEAIRFLNDTVDATLRRNDGPVACKKGCSHCCHIWVSATPPEILAIAKIVRSRGPAALDKVREAFEGTKDFTFETRYDHPYPCPLLEDDVCSIYADRPKVCRLAASVDADVCARTYLNITNEGVPTPGYNVRGREVYVMVLATALHHAGLAHHAYEFNAGLHRALTTDRAEERWLADEDIFHDIHQDPQNVLDNEEAKILYQHAFPST